MRTLSIRATRQLLPSGCGTLVALLLCLFCVQTTQAQAITLPTPPPLTSHDTDPHATVAAPELPPAAITSGPLGDPSNRLSYNLADFGYDENGALAEGWSPAHRAEIEQFLAGMVPVLHEIYGPPSIPYTVTLVRDLRRAANAMFMPSTDSIHLGDTATWQLITHELIHAWRNDRILSSDANWQYEPTLSGFEEGFAHAVAYVAMTEFARRHPEFPLPQRIYQSSAEWDYDFQNVPELRTTDFWSDQGGMNLSWMRYEMAAAAITKIALEYPDFYRAFNAEYYRRLNADPALISSRPLIVSIIQTVAPIIEGRPAAEWIDLQHIFYCAVDPGYKIWRYARHYPSEEYFDFNQIYFYRTFDNGSNWAEWDGSDWRYHDLNGAQGTSELHSHSGELIWQRPLQAGPATNPPEWMGYGSAEINLTTQSSNLPWPGGDPATYVTNLSSFGLYQLDVQFSTEAATVARRSYHVLGDQLRSTKGIFGGIIGGEGGTIFISHRNHPSETTLPVINGAFWGQPAWASLPAPAEEAVNTIPGQIDVTYVDGAGKVYTDTRTIQWGSWNGNQAFLFNVNLMHQSRDGLTEQSALLASAEGQFANPVTSFINDPVAANLPNHIFLPIAARQ